MKESAATPKQKSGIWSIIRIMALFFAGGMLLLIIALGVVILPDQIRPIADLPGPSR
jgi:hypothetical protein